MKVLGLDVRGDESLSPGMARLQHDGVTLCTLYRIGEGPETPLVRIEQGIASVRMMGSPEPTVLLIWPALRPNLAAPATEKDGGA